MCRLGWRICIDLIYKRYRVQREIRRSGGNAVYAATDEFLGCEVTLIEWAGADHTIRKAVSSLDLAPDEGENFSAGDSAYVVLAGSETGRRALERITAAGAFPPGSFDLLLTPGAKFAAAGKRSEETGQPPLVPQPHPEPEAHRKVPDLANPTHPQESVKRSRTTAEAEPASKWRTARRIVAAAAIAAALGLWVVQMLSPTIELSLDPNSGVISCGQTITLQWHTTNASEVWLEAKISGGQDEKVAAEGKKTIRPPCVSGTYVLRAKGRWRDVTKSVDVDATSRDPFRKGQ